MVSNYISNKINLRTWLRYFQISGGGGAGNLIVDATLGRQINDRGTCFFSRDFELFFILFSSIGIYYYERCKKGQQGLYSSGYMCVCVFVHVGQTTLQRLQQTAENIINFFSKHFSTFFFNFTFLTNQTVFCLQLVTLHSFHLTIARIRPFFMR